MALAQVAYCDDTEDEVAGGRVLQLPLMGVPANAFFTKIDESGVEPFTVPLWSNDGYKWDSIREPAAQASETRFSCISVGASRSWPPVPMNTGVCSAKVG